MNDLQIPDTLFPNDNHLEIPTLRLDMQAQYAAIPFVLYGEQKRTYDMKGGGTLQFYTDDYRFEAIYEHPEKILHHNPMNIVEPNFSLYSDTPIAFGMQAVYKKRFIARAMQDKGIRVFVDLNVAPKFYKLNLIGVPPGYSAFCTRGYSDRLNNLAFEYEMAKMVAGDNSLLFVCYGGGEVCKKFCRENGLVYATPTVKIKQRALMFDRMKETIAFFGTEIDPSELMPQLKELPTLEQLSMGQVENYRHGIEQKTSFEGSV